MRSAKVKDDVARQRRLYIVLALVGLYDRYQNLMNWLMYIIVELNGT